ncbi:glycosyltransferase family 9 protein [Thermodesulfobacteriota bacterium]
MKRWYRDTRVHLIYLGRLSRAQVLRALLRLSLFLFALEERINPAKRSEEMRILVMVVGGMGDCLLCDSMFRRIREKWPHSRIDVMFMSFPELWKRMESFDNYLFFSPEQPKMPWSYFQLFRTLYRNHYDIAAEGLAMLPKQGIYPIFSGIVLEASRAPIRIGRRTAGRNILLHPRRRRFFFHKMMSDVWSQNGENKDAGTDSCVTHIIKLLPPEKRSRHESARVFTPLGIEYKRTRDEPKILPDPLLDTWAQNLLRGEWAKQDDIIVGFTIETTKSIKSWPRENFASILERGIRNNLKFVMLGLNPEGSESPLQRFSGDRLLDLTGKTGLGEMIAVIGRCDLFFSCDTGPAHIAQALRVPTTVLFGPSNEREFGPSDHELHTLILPPEEFKCRPCVLGPCVKGKTCMQAISPEVVFNAIMKKAGDLTGCWNGPSFDCEGPERV